MVPNTANPIPITSLLDVTPGDSDWFALQMVKATGCTWKVWLWLWLHD